MPYIADIIILFNIMIHVGLIQVLVVATLWHVLPHCCSSVYWHSLQHGWTPLMWAAMYGHVGCINLLLDRGAQPNLQDKVRAFACRTCYWNHEGLLCRCDASIIGMKGSIKDYEHFNSGSPSIYRGEGPKRTGGAKGGVVYIRFRNRLLLIIHTNEC